MYRIIIALLALAVLLVLARWIKQEYKKKGRPFAVKALLVSVAVIFALLAFTGRVHWLSALLAGLLAGLRFALPLLLRSAPFLQQIYKAKAEQQANQNHQNHAMSAEEAMEILGLADYQAVKNLDKQLVIEAHRKLIQKVHPDRGGNDYLASQLNQAKATLLKLIDQ